MFDLDELDYEVKAGNVRVQRHPDLPLRIFNYTEAAAYASHWTPVTLACRGLILDDHGAIVARPFPKFFNLEELVRAGHSVPLDSNWTATEKMDGSLGIVTPLRGRANRSDSWQLCFGASHRSTQDA